MWSRVAKSGRKSCVGFLETDELPEYWGEERKIVHHRPSDRVSCNFRVLGVRRGKSFIIARQIECRAVCRCLYGGGRHPRTWKFQSIGSIGVRRGKSFIIARQIECRAVQVDVLKQRITRFLLGFEHRISERRRVERSTLSYYVQREQRGE
ncbi:hypothetical protein RRG08_064565 [Elysia crispata]|uniref:Uncharacterized protein n=1 Tax=Elysia crispata TaxID=231223 RepID=A0AAE1BAG9_9GAST|nr:hypothetical protein RRG08_064565 [Elysia crispata]